MNAPIYYMLHALPVVLILGTAFFVAGIFLGKVLWKKTQDQADQFLAEIRECEEKISGFDAPSDEKEVVV